MKDEKTVLNSLEIIEDCIFERVSTKYISQNIFLSKHYFQRLFHETVGDSVINYVKRRKLSLAGKELISSTQTVLDIALQFGYSSHESFTRAFKAYMGITPYDYRKYQVSTISQKQLVKEIPIMQNQINYSKSTDEILRDLNDFIVTIKKVAECVNKRADEMKLTGVGVISGETNVLADRLFERCKAINSLSDNFSEINKRFEIIKALEDIAFMTNVLAFNLNLQLVRLPEQKRKQLNEASEKLLNVASTAQEKVGRTFEMFEELAQLIYADMEENVASQLNKVVELTAELHNFFEKEVNKSNSFSNIVIDELMAITNETKRVDKEAKKANSESVEKGIEVALSAQKMNSDFMFRLEILSLHTKIENDSKGVEVTNELYKKLMQTSELCKECLNNALETYKIMNSFQKKASSPKAVKTLGEFTFQLNILLFYSKVEASRLRLDETNSLFAHEVERAISNGFETVRKIQEYIANALNDENVDDCFKVISKEICVISEKLEEASVNFKENGNVVCYIAQEFNNLSKRVVG